MRSIIQIYPLISDIDEVREETILDFISCIRHLSTDTTCQQVNSFSVFIFLFISDIERMREETLMLLMMMMSILNNSNGLDDDDFFFNLNHFFVFLVAFSL